MLSGPFRATGTYTFEPLDGDTRLNLVMEGEPVGVMKLAAAALGPAIKRQVVHWGVREHAMGAALPSSDPGTPCSGTGI